MIARIAVFGLFFSLLTGCDKPHPQLNVAGSGWIGYQPYYLADALLRLPEPEDDIIPDLTKTYSSWVNVTKLVSAVSVMRHFANGELNAAMLTLDEALHFQSDTGIDLCLAQIINYSEGADALVVDPSRYAAALENGRLRVGYESGSTNAFLLFRAQEVLGINDLELEQVPITPNEHVGSFAQNELDALITYEPYLSQLLSEGFKKIFSSADIPFEIIDLLVVRREFWQAYGPQLLDPLQNLWDFGLSRMLNPDVRSQEIITANTGLSDTTLQMSLQGLHLLSFDEGQRALDQKLAHSIDKVGRYLLANGAIDTIPDLRACR